MAVWTDTKYVYHTQENRHHSFQQKHGTWNSEIHRTYFSLASGICFDTLSPHLPFYTKVQCTKCIDITLIHEFLDLLSEYGEILVYSFSLQFISVMDKPIKFCSC